MANEIYILKHCYDVDGGFGDSIPQESTLFITDDKEFAYAYKAKHHKPEVYAVPYAALWHHAIRIETLTMEKPDINKDPWEGNYSKEKYVGYTYWDDDDDEY